MKEINMVQEKTVPKKRSGNGVRQFWLHPDYKWHVTYDTEGMPVLYGIPLSVLNKINSYDGAPRYMSITAMRFHVRMSGVDHNEVGKMSDKTIVKLFNRMFVTRGKYIGVDENGKDVKS
jgi:hypothetical protein